MAQKRRNRPDKDGIDRSKVDAFRKQARFKRLPCILCGLPINYELQFPNPWSFTVEHLIPISQGGSSRADNLGAAHFRCNRLKGEHRALTPLQVNQLRLEQGCTTLVPLQNGAQAQQVQQPTYTQPHTDTSGTEYTEEQLQLIIDTVYTAENCMHYEGGGYGLKPEVAAIYKKQIAAVARAFEKII